MQWLSRFRCVRHSWRLCFVYSCILPLFLFACRSRVADDSSSTAQSRSGDPCAYDFDCGSGDVCTDKGDGDSPSGVCRLAEEAFGMTCPVHSQAPIMSRAPAATESMRVEQAIGADAERRYVALATSVHDD